jgi:hypothetical protein
MHFSIRKNRTVPFILSIVLLAICLVGAVHFHKDRTNEDNCPFCALYSTLGISLVSIALIILFSLARSFVSIDKFHTIFSATCFHVFISRAPPAF